MAITLRVKDLTERQKKVLEEDGIASIDITGSLRGMYSRFGWKKEAVVKVGSYYYHIPNNDQRRRLGLDRI